MPENTAPPVNEEENKVPTAQELHDMSLAEVLAEDNGDAWDTETNPQPETPAPTETPPVPTNEEPTPPVVEPPTYTPEVTPPPPPIDSDLISQQVAERVIKTLNEQASPKTDAQKEALNEAIKNAPWVREGRNPTYEEIIGWSTPLIKEQVKSEIKQELQDEVEAEDKATQEETAKAEQLKNQTDQFYHRNWNAQFSELEQTGKIPKMVNSSDENDAGVKVRKEMIKMMEEDTISRIKNGQPPIEDFRTIYYQLYSPKYPSGKSAQPAGVDAPVAGAGQAVGQGSDSDSYEYKDIHNAPISTFLTGK